MTIPGAILHIAFNLMPSRAGEAQREEGIDLEKIIQLLDNPEARGSLVELDDHKKGEPIIVSLAQPRPPQPPL